MIIHVKGSNKAVRKLVEIAAWYYAEKLMGKRLINNLEINIKLKKDMFEKDNTEGTAIWEDESYWPKEFTIELDCDTKVRNILITLAHEMVHIKQWAKGEMYEYAEPGKVRFMKTKYDMNDLNYWDFPWEIEAFGRQLGLFVRFCEDNGFANRSDMMEEI
ncbi:hypothetical protein [uncultured Hyphomonas sp.]|uniref:hypothetical protein n=1 Tax=uncultured Hyphomonas sp. TaxID=225298 RepID=UPI00260E2F6A|nr:hypothetical protein [uncultured Hyphomonas sp.]